MIVYSAFIALKRRVRKMIEPKVLFVQVIDGTAEDINAVREGLSSFKEKFPFPVEFIVANQKVELHSVKYLIDMLYALYKQYKETNEAQLKKLEEIKK